MKKTIVLFIVVLLSIMAMSCEPVTVYEDKPYPVYIEVPDNAPDNYYVIGDWQGAGKIWMFEEDYSFSVIGDTDPTDIQLSGTYTMVTDGEGNGTGVHIYDVLSDADGIYNYQVIYDYPGYRDITLKLDAAWVAGYTWIEYIKIAD